MPIYSKQLYIITRKSLKIKCIYLKIERYYIFKFIFTPWTNLKTKLNSSGFNFLFKLAFFFMIVIIEQHTY